MKIVNQTSYPTAELRSLAHEACAGLDAKNTTVIFLPSRKWCSGRAWCRARLVRIWLPSAHRFPFTGFKRHRSSPVNHDWQDWREAVVALSAHELRHIDLGSLRHVRRTQQDIEMSCEAFEHGALRRYRERSSRTMSSSAS